MNIIKPKRLKKGDTIGIIALSTPIAKSGDTAQRSYEYLRNKGFNIVEAKNCRKNYGHSAGTIAERVKSLHDFIKDDKIDAIMAYWGGFQTHQVLEYLDYELIKKHPKIIIGFSDTTALTVGIYAKTGLVTFSGPAGITFGKPIVPDYTWNNFSNVLMQGKSPLVLSASKTYSDNKWWESTDKKMIFNKDPGWKTYKKGTARGEIVGGNIGTMLLLLGTPYWPDLEGKILFVEDDEDENPRTVDRFFTQLRQMGVYSKIKGMVIGRWHTKTGFTKDDSFELILKDSLNGHTIPVIYNVDFGHTDPLITIPMGIKCKIDTSKREITYLEPGVK